MAEPESPADRKLLADVEEFGWHVINVLEDEEGPPFSYTVGLFRRFAHPEVVVVGLPSKAAHPILNIVGGAVRDGRHFVAGQSYDDFVNGYAATFRVVPPEKYPPYLGYAMWFYDGPEFPVLQLVYPDRWARWPWEDGVDPAFRERQPVIADEPEPPWASRPAP